MNTAPPAAPAHNRFVARLTSVDPIWCVCVMSVTVMLLASYVGSVCAYAFLGCWLLLASTRLGSSARIMGLDWQIWVFPAFAALSAAWSQAHWVSFRFALEYVATAGCAALAARLLSPRRMGSALLVALGVVSILCLAVHRSIFNEMTETLDYVGVFRTKNELGFFISLLLLVGVAVMLDSGQPVLFRMLALVSLVPTAPLLMKSHSATSLVTLAVAIMVLIGNFLLSQLDQRQRTRVLFGLAISILPLLALIGMAGGLAHDFVVHVLGRSTTMTGRTVLWAHAFRLMPEHPLGGWGWQAFWLRSSPNAEGLWALFHITTRQGFQFQNTFLEAAIELGWIGCALLAVVVLATLIRAIRWSWRDRSVAASFYVALMVCFIIRALVEVDILYQFSIGAFMFFVSMCYAFDRGRAARRAGMPAVQARSGLVGIAAALPRANTGYRH